VLVTVSSRSADDVLVDPENNAAQEKQTFLRRELIYKDGNVMGAPKGAYLMR
jgi:hypothetical protein